MIPADVGVPGRSCSSSVGVQVEVQWGSGRQGAASESTFVPIASDPIAMSSSVIQWQARGCDRHCGVLFMRIPQETQHRSSPSLHSLKMGGQWISMTTVQWSR